MGQILVTGFKPFSLLTWAAGNPSESIAVSLGEKYGPDARVSIMKADPTCLKAMESLGHSPDVRGVLMFGTSMQLSPLILELEGVRKEGWLTNAVRYPSSGAKRFAGYAKSIGIPSTTAPVTPLVYWCLRSYAAALEWSEPKGIPCIFLHANTLSLSGQVNFDRASALFEKLRDHS